MVARTLLQSDACAMAVWAKLFGMVGQSLSVRAASLTELELGGLLGLVLGGWVGCFWLLGLFVCMAALGTRSTRSLRRPLFPCLVYCSILALIVLGTS